MADDAIEAGFEEWGTAFVDAFNFVEMTIDAHNFIAELRETCGGHAADVAKAEYGNPDRHSNQYLNTTA